MYNNTPYTTASISESLKDQYNIPVEHSLNVHFNDVDSNDICIANTLTKQYQNELGTQSPHLWSNNTS